MGVHQRAWLEQCDKKGLVEVEEALLEVITLILIIYLLRDFQIIHIIILEILHLMLCYLILIHYILLMVFLQFFT